MSDPQAPAPVQSAPSVSDMAAPAPSVETPAPATPALGTEPVGTLARDPDSPERLSDQELEDLLFADPFAKKPEAQGTAPAAPTPPAQREPQKQAGVATPAAPTPGPKGQVPAPQAAVQTPPAPTPDPRDQAIARLEQQLQQQQILMQTFIGQQGQQQPQPGTQAPVGPGNDPSIPSYMFQLPDDLVNGMASEDPMIRRASLQALVQGALKSAHFEIMKTVRAEMEQAIPGKVEGVVSKTREQDTIRNDYFTAFPNHRAVAELVGSVTRQVFAETGAQQWSPVIRNAIGQRVNYYLSQANPQQPQAPAPQAPQAPVAPPLAPAPQPAQAPFIFGTSASPAVGPASGSNPNAPQGIFDTLFG